MRPFLLLNIAEELLTLEVSGPAWARASWTKATKLSFDLKNTNFLKEMSNSGESLSLGQQKKPVAAFLRQQLVIFVAVGAGHRGSCREQENCWVELVAGSIGKNRGNWRMYCSKTWTRLDGSFQVCRKFLGGAGDSCVSDTDPLGGTNPRKFCFCLESTHPGFSWTGTMGHPIHFCLSRSADFALRSWFAGILIPG